PFSFRARNQLALSAIARGQLDEAEEKLRDNLKGLRFEPDAEAKETTLFTLGDLYSRRKEYRKAVDPLAEALGVFANSPRAMRARLQLAESFRRLASQQNFDDIQQSGMSEETKKHYLKMHRDWLQKAADEYQLLAYLLDKIHADRTLDEETRRQMMGDLTAEERADAPFVAAACYFDLGRYEEALTNYQILAEQYRLLLEDQSDADCVTTLSVAGVTGKGVRPLEGV